MCEAAAGRTLDDADGALWLAAWGDGGVRLIALSYSARFPGSLKVAKASLRSAALK